MTINQQYQTATALYVVLEFLVKNAGDMSEFKGRTETLPPRQEFDPRESYVDRGRQQPTPYRRLERGRKA